MSSLSTTPAKRKGRARVSSGPIPYHVIPVLSHDDLSESFEGPLLVTHEVNCNGPLCSGNDRPIQGLRYRCFECNNPEWNFCEECVREPIDNHDDQHSLIECSELALFAETREGQVTMWPLNASAEGAVGVPVIYRNGVQPHHDFGDSDGGVDWVMSPTLEPGTSHTASKGPKKRTVQHHASIIGHNGEGNGKGKGRMPTEYEYRLCPIDRSPGVLQTRLIRLHPGQGDDRLECSFLVLSLHGPKEGKEKFDVLSTSWHNVLERKRASRLSAGTNGLGGALPEDGSFAVYVDNMYFVEASKGVFEALKCLRKPDKARVLWVDELCAPANDKAERLYQARMTALIHSYATKAIVWAGPAQLETGDTEQAWGILQLLCAKFLGDDEGTVRETWPTPQEVREDGDIIGFEENLGDGAGWQEIFRLFPKVILVTKKCKYHDAMFAPEARFRCGAFRLPWKDTLSVAEMLSTRPWLQEFYPKALS